MKKKKNEGDNEEAMEMQREMQNRRGNEEMKNKENKEKQVDAN
jgi:hypothetical protein